MYQKPAPTKMPLESIKLKTVPLILIILCVSSISGVLIGYLIGTNNYLSQSREPTLRNILPQPPPQLKTTKAIYQQENSQLENPYIVAKTYGYELTDKQAEQIIGSDNQKPIPNEWLKVDELIQNSSQIFNPPYLCDLHLYGWCGTVPEGRDLQIECKDVDTSWPTNGNTSSCCRAQETNRPYLFSCVDIYQNQAQSPTSNQTKEILKRFGINCDIANTCLEARETDLYYQEKIKPQL